MSTNTQCVPVQRSDLFVANKEYDIHCSTRLPDCQQSSPKPTLEQFKCTAKEYNTAMAQMLAADNNPAGAATVNNLVNMKEAVWVNTRSVSVVLEKPRGR